MLHTGLKQTSHLHRAKVDQPHTAIGIEHDVGRAQVLMQHFQPVEGAQAAGNLFDDVAHPLQRGLRIIAHPLGQGLAFDVLTQAVEIAARPPRRRGLHHVRVINSACDPLFGQQSLQLHPVLLLLNRGSLEHHLRTALLILHQVDVAASASMQLTDHPQAINNLARLQHWRQRQIGKLAVQLGRLPAGQAVDAQQLYGEVVVTAVGQRLGNQGFGSLLQVAAAGANQLSYPRRVDELIDPVGRQQKHLTRFQRQ